MARLFRALGRWARNARDLFPVTWLGLLVGGGSALALFHFGVERIDLVLLVVGIVGLGLVALSILLVAASALVVWLKVRKRTVEGPLALECGYPKRTGYSFGSPWFVPFVRVGWSWLEPRVHLTHRRHGLRLLEEIVPVHRGIRDSILRRFEVSDTFGLARVAFRAREARDVRFLPSIGNLRQVHVVRSMSEGDQISHPDGPPHGERIDMRQYSAGDPIRFILWKVFAKSREVVVRTPERALGPVHQTVAYVVTGDKDEPGAGAARVAVDCGALGGDWVLGADGCDGTASSSAQALELLAQSGDAPLSAGGAGLRRFLETATPGSLGRALVFVPGRPGPWLDRVLATVGRERNLPQVEFLVVTDGIEPARPTRIPRIALRDDQRLEPRDGVGAVTAEELAEVCQRLAALRTRVTVLDRLTGRVYNEAHQRALTQASSSRAKGAAA
jgi:hypothetical protein